MAKIRVERNKGYTVMSNYHLKDKTLTLKSKGLLSMMLSLPDEWHYSTRGLAAICKEGVDAIGAALKELEKAGYIIRNQIRGERGRIVETEYVIYEQPGCMVEQQAQLATGPQSKPPPLPPSSPEPEIPPTPAGSGLSPHTAFPYMVNPDVENPDTESPDMENPAQYITNKSTKKTESKNVSNIQSINQSLGEADEQQPLPCANAPPQRDRRIDRTEETEAYRSLIMENIEYEHLVGRYSRERMDEIVEVMMDAVCTRKEYIRVDGDEKPAEIVKSRLLKLDPSHIEYVFDRLDKNTSKVYNIKAYLLTTLYNAPATIDHYYRAEVQHDLYGFP